MTDISIGLIGAGMMGQEHIQNFNLLDGVRVGAIADTNASMRDTAAALCAQKITPMADFEKLLTDPSLDAFVIATPNFHHIDVLRPALETGKPILCEKPLCTTLENTREILTRLEADKQIFQVGMEYRFKPALADMIARVDAGETGRLHMLSIREHRFPFLQKVDDWNRFNRNTGGTLVEKCCHFFDLMRRIIGSEPVRVMASAGRDVNHLDESYHGDVPDILDNAYVIFDFENGARAFGFVHVRRGLAPSRRIMRDWRNRKSRVSVAAKYRGARCPRRLANAKRNRACRKGNSRRWLSFGCHIFSKSGFFESRARRGGCYCNSR